MPIPFADEIIPLGNFGVIDDASMKGGLHVWAWNPIVDAIAPTFLSANIPVERCKGGMPVYLFDTTQQRMFPFMWTGAAWADAAVVAPPVAAGITMAPYLDPATPAFPAPGPFVMKSGVETVCSTTLGVITNVSPLVFNFAGFAGSVPTRIGNQQGDLYLLYITNSLGPEFIAFVVSRIDADTLQGIWTGALPFNNNGSLHFHVYPYAPVSIIKERYFQAPNGSVFYSTQLGVGGIPRSWFIYTGSGSRDTVRVSAFVDIGQDGNDSYAGIFASDPHVVDTAKEVVRGFELSVISILTLGVYALYIRTAPGTARLTNNRFTQRNSTTSAPHLGIGASPDNDPMTGLAVTMPARIYAFLYCPDSALTPTLTWSKSQFPTPLVGVLADYVPLGSVFISRHRSTISNSDLLGQLYIDGEGYQHFRDPRTEEFTVSVGQELRQTDSASTIAGALLEINPFILMSGSNVGSDWIVDHTITITETGGASSVLVLLRGLNQVTDVNLSASEVVELRIQTKGARYNSVLQTNNFGADRFTLEKISGTSNSYSISCVSHLVAAK